MMMNNVYAILNTTNMAQYADVKKANDGDFKEQLQGKVKPIEAVSPIEATTAINEHQEKNSAQTAYNKFKNAHTFFDLNQFTSETSES
ncbi:MAG: hypothetical protein ATN36_04430 [Epulopiscium sp. Nele67-Bin005]|nr:MAG: hypothetical protein ATN36_04430 [Epulopiscium sp. Nele67-Bin005]